MLDLPRYSWDTTFSAPQFMEAISNFNKEQSEHLCSINRERGLGDPPGKVLVPIIASFPLIVNVIPCSLYLLVVRMFYIYLTLLLEDKLVVRRIVAGKTVDEVLQTDLFIPIWMPPNFVAFARELVGTVSKDHPEVGIEDVLDVIWEPKFRRNREIFSLTRFNLSPIMMYQQIDRRLDE